MSKEDIMRIRNEFKEVFCLRCYLSKSENWYGFSRSGLKTGVENYIFWTDIGSGFGEPGDSPPSKRQDWTSRQGAFGLVELQHFLISE